MTNTETTPPNKKRQKAKGPIRTEAVVPVAIVLALTIAYFSFYFDAHLKGLIEWTGTQILGAEVNVESLHTSFIKGSFELNGFEATDKEKPSHNLFQIGQIRYGFVWDALLRVKFVISEAVVDNIQVAALRKKPGFVVPKKPEPEKGGKGLLDSLEDTLMSQAKEHISGQTLGNLGGFLQTGDTNALLKNLQANLKTEAKIKELQTQLETKKKIWDERLKSLPQKKELDDLVARAKAVKIDSSNPVALAASLKNIESIVREADEKVKLFNQVNTDLNSDLAYFDKNFKSIDGLIKQDMADVQRSLKVPSVDTAELSKSMFAGLLFSKLGSMQKYYLIAQEFMADEPGEKEKKREEQVIPRPRSAGRTYKFPITTGYPLFWMKLARISSEPTQSKMSGRLKGQITDLTSDPIYIKRPTIVTLVGDFPASGMYGLDVKVTLDHTKKPATDSVVARLQSYPVEGRELSNTDDLKMAITKASGEIFLNAVVEGGNINLTLNNNFKNIEYNIKSKTQMVEDVLKNIVADIPVVSVNASAKGPWSSLAWDVNSNLGQGISDGFKKQINAKIEEAKVQIRSFIDQRVAGEKQKLEGQLDATKNQVMGDLNNKKSELEKTKNQANAQIESGKNQAKNEQNKQLEDAGKKAAEELKKKLGL